MCQGQIVFGIYHGNRWQSRLRNPNEIIQRQKEVIYIQIFKSSHAHNWETTIGACTMH